jgi:hypothetical protein
VGPLWVFALLTLMLSGLDVVAVVFFGPVIERRRQTVCKSRECESVGSNLQLTMYEVKCTCRYGRYMVVVDTKFSDRS